jgi:hypothetical protein
MVRILVLAVAIVLCDGLLHKEARAAVVSPRNPFRSYNISGVNYGSMQWEKSHRQSNYRQRRSGGIVFRRR